MPGSSLLTQCRNCGIEYELGESSARKICHQPLSQKLSIPASMLSLSPGIPATSIRGGFKQPGDFKLELQRSVSSKAAQLSLLPSITDELLHLLYTDLHCVYVAEMHAPPLVFAQAMPLLDLQRTTYYADTAQTKHRPPFLESESTEGH